MANVGLEHTGNLFSRRAQPVLTVAQGEEVTFATMDASGNRIRTVEDGMSVFLPPEKANPITGPVYVTGARPGDTLVVEIVNIKLGPQGYCRIKPGSGIIIDELKPPRVNIIPVEGDTVHFSPKIRFPARPMVGTIGVAPAGEPVASFYPGPHGGNLDINDVRVGSRIHFPVAVEGALLCLGDVHASMGDGELTGGGIDIEAEVTVQARVLPGRQWPRPWLETPTYWVTCGFAPALQDAIRMATSDMATLLAENLAITREEAFILIGSRGDARPGQCAELGMDATARVAVPRLV